MEETQPRLTRIQKLILKLLEDHPDGLDIYEIRAGLPDEIEVQQHLDRRVRGLRKYYDVPGEQRGDRYVYVLKGLRSDPVQDDGAVSSKLRAEVLHRAKGRCQMCGKTVEGDGIRLQVDHKIPHNWGGPTEIDNLWALCALCNSGKRDYFSSFDDETMERVLAPESVYERLLETMRLNFGGPTPSWLLEFVANADDFQEDWQKRARELRYPVIGVEFNVTKEKLASGKVVSAYVLMKDVALPENHKFLIKEHERLTKKKRNSRD